jgi:pimeloyl-ACP methyl ester carboxylesterase
MTTVYLPRGAGRIAYSVEGTGPLVVCVPGMGELRSLYRFLAPALVQAGLRVATMDLRGHGDSDDGFDRYDDVAAGQDALALIEELGGPAVVVGTSMGAGAAVWAAAERPDLVAGLVLAGPFVRNPPTNPVLALLLRLAFLRPWGPAALKAYLVKAYPGRRPADFDQHWADLRAAQRRGDHWRSFVRTSRTDHGPAQARLGEVKAPALVIMGEKDPDWSDPRAEARYVTEALGGAELLLVPDAGHYVAAEYPEVMSPAVTAFAHRIHAPRGD